MSGGLKYRCPNCKEVLQSMHQHDFVTCGCGEVSVDGGSAYTRLVWANEYPELVEETHEEAL